MGSGTMFGGVAQEETGWWCDDPIENSAQDGFGRLQFVEQVIGVLGQVARRPSSSVVALVGPWGSGKTSTANLVLGMLDRDHWGVSRLNPWALGSADAIVTELLGAIASALPTGAPGKRAREKLRDYATAGAPLLSLIPTVGSTVEKIVTTAVKSADSNTIQEHFERVSRALNELCHPVLVFVDDVDRLHPDELTALFRAVRVLGRLPYVHYMIAYDQRTILDLLTATSVAKGDENRALAFLEKIVTVPVDQPAIHEDQAALLFDDGLTRLLDDLHLAPTEEQQQRLATEWELLLADDLAQPRGIRRLLAQLRMYLPPIANDVDIVDYVLVTHLRLSYPRLYQSLRSDRRILPGTSSNAGRERLQTWQDGTALDDLGLGKRRTPLLEGIHRLFPAIVGDDVPASPRSRGIDDVNYTDRYFVFGFSENEVSDAELLDRMRTWAASGELPSTLAWAFTPSPSDRRAATRRASLIRRLAGLTEQLGVENATRLLRAVVDQLPPPVSGRLLIGRPSAALEHLLTQLISTADDPGVPEIVDTAYRHGMRTFLSFLNCLPRSRRGDASWRARLVQHAAKRGWQAFLGHVQAGKDAPDEPTASLFGRIEQLIGSRRADRLLQKAVDAGMSPVDIAARFVQVDDLGGEIGPVFRDFEADDLVNRIGVDRIRRRSAELEPHISDDLARDDMGWAGRRRYAKIALADAAGLRVVYRSGLPKVLDPFGAGRRVQVLDVASDEPDLRISVSALLPAGDRVPEPTAATRGPTGDQREQILRAQLDASALSEWLRHVAAHAWPLEFAGWQVSEPGDGRSVTRLTATPPSEVAGDGVRQPAVLAGALIRSGSDKGNPFLVADYSIGLWLTKLDSDRSLVEKAAESRPLPAALSLAELQAMLVAVMTTALTSSQALFRALAGGSSQVRFGALPGVSNARGSITAVKVDAEAPHEIDAVLKLGALPRAGRGTGSRSQSATFRGQTTWAAPRAERASREWAFALTAEWLMQSGYRGYEDELQRASNTEIG